MFLPLTAFWLGGLANSFVPNEKPVQSLKRCGKMTAAWLIGLVVSVIMILMAILL